MRIKSTDPHLMNITKERFAVSQVRNGLSEFSIVILVGLSGTGKTIALLQLASEYENAEYLDCGDEKYTTKLHELQWSNLNNYDGLLLLDNFHLLDAHADWLLYTFTNVIEDNKKFKVVISSSVVPYIIDLSRMKMRGENKLIYMSSLTYLEYLFFTDRILSYNVNLSQINYKNSFGDYTKLKPCRDLPGIPTFDSNYVASIVSNITEAKKGAHSVTSFLGFTKEDIKRALLLLILIGVRDCQTISDNFSVCEAARTNMTNKQICEALKYLLWTGLVLCTCIKRSIDERINTSTLAAIMINHTISDNELSCLFGKCIQLYVTNPIIYSLISEELWEVLISYLPNEVKLFQKVKYSAADWIENYLRGSFARRCPIPLRTTSFQNLHRRELGAWHEDFENLFIDFSLMNKEKTVDDLNFHLVYTGKETCILTTNKIFDKVIWNDIPICRIPYSMLAAYLDRGEVPKEDLFKILV